MQNWWLIACLLDLFIHWTFPSEHRWGDLGPSSGLICHPLRCGLDPGCSHLSCAGLRDPDSLWDPESLRTFSTGPGVCLWGQILVLCGSAVYLDLTYKRHTNISGSDQGQKDLTKVYVCLTSWWTLRSWSVWPRTVSSKRAGPRMNKQNYFRFPNLNIHDKGLGLSLPEQGHANLRSTRLVLTYRLELGSSNNFGSRLWKTCRNTSSLPRPR